ncbi:MAG: sulfatase-like hydrolase/transferase, partial [Armatimonadota bacterium]
MNVLFIAIDTLRADYLGCYGYPKPTSPTIDALAASGVCFENAFSVASYTHPNYTSMFTGRYPITHGVVLQSGDYYLPDEIPVLPEMLKSSGY